MEHGAAYATWGAAAFWIFIGIAAWASHWERARRNAERHETMRRIIEKTGTVDEARLKELFNPTLRDWTTGAAGDSYRGLMVAGTIVMSVAVGAVLFFLILGQADVIPQKSVIIGVAASFILVMVAAGLFVSTRFVERPSGSTTRGHD